jgi:hypothetical protein
MMQKEMLDKKVKDLRLRMMTMMAAKQAGLREAQEREEGEGEGEGED